MYLYLARSYCIRESESLWENGVHIVRYHFNRSALCPRGCSRWTENRNYSVTSGKAIVIKQLSTYTHLKIMRNWSTWLIWDFTLSTYVADKLIVTSDWADAKVTHETTRIKYLSILKLYFMPKSKYFEWISEQSHERVQIATVLVESIYKGILSSIRCM